MLISRGLLWSEVGIFDKRINMIKSTRGDILKADAEALVNTVNCVGVMGRGIALQFKKKFPDNFKQYKKKCDRKELVPGTMFVFDTGNMFGQRYVVNFPTKNHWRGKSEMSDVESGLVALVEQVRTRNIKSIAIPPLGCGLGGLNWNEVKPLIEAAFAELPNVQVLLYEPGHAPAAEKMIKEEKVPNMTKGRAAMIGLMRKYRAAAMDPFVTLLEIHKLMYFMVAFGEPIKNMKYRKGPYGPYSENLHFVLDKTEGHYTLGFADGGEEPDKPITLMDGAIEKAEAALESEEDTRANFEKVSELIAGFETPFGMELLATVHWVANDDGATTHQEALKLIGEWTPRKRDLFSPRHVELAWNVLEQNELLATEN